MYWRYINNFIIMNIMKSSDTINLTKLEKFQQQLTKSELTLKSAVNKYQQLYNQLKTRESMSQNNNQKSLTIFFKIASVSFKPLQIILRFLQDSDILAFAATCKSLFRLIYSPFGYRIIRSLRPPIVKVRRDRQMPTFNKNFLQNLCSEVNLIGYDEDDKIAIIQTMRTNLIAARQKIKEIQRCNLEWDRRNKGVRQQIGKAILKRQEQQKRIELTNEQIQKLNELLQQSSDNVKALKEQQQKMLLERENRKKDLQMQKEKLIKQKDLLIKKIKSQQKQRQEGLIYAREVSRITSMLNKLTVKK